MSSNTESAPATATATATNTSKAKIPSSIKINNISVAKSLIRAKLYDPCTVCRYETIHYNRQDEIDKDETHDDNHSITAMDASAIASTNGENGATEETTTKQRRQNIVSQSPSLRLNQEEAMSLSYLPWKIEINNMSSTKRSSTTATETSHNVNPNDNDSKYDQYQNQYQNMYHPPWNYLSIRHDQNYNWAQSQLEKGVQYAKTALQQQQQQSQHSSSSSPSLISSLLQKAETCYKQGLDLIPFHVGLLTAYSALCINDQRYIKAKNMLHDAIQYGQSSSLGHPKKKDLNNDTTTTTTNTSVQSILQDARLYLRVVEEKLKKEEERKQKKNHTLSSGRKEGGSLSFYNMNDGRNKAQKITLSNKVNDILTERLMFQDDDGNNTNKNGNGENNDNEKDHLGNGMERISTVQRNKRGENGTRQQQQCHIPNRSNVNQIYELLHSPSSSSSCKYNKNNLGDESHESHDDNEIKSISSSSSRSGHRSRSEERERERERKRKNKYKKRNKTSKRRRKKRSRRSSINQNKYEASIDDSSHKRKKRKKKRKSEH